MADKDVAHGLFGPGIFGTGIDLTALDGDTALRLGLFMGESMMVARIEAWTDVIRVLRDRNGGAGSAVGRLLARTDGDANGIQIAAELADFLESIAPKMRATAAYRRAKEATDG